MANPSTIWTQLAIPFPAAGSIPFVANDNATIVTDVGNISYNPVTCNLNLTHQIIFYYINSNIGALAPTINAPTGRLQSVPGFSSMTVTNSYVNANSLVFCQVESADATATFIKQVQVSAGQFVVNFNANATGSVYFSFMVVN